MFANAYGAARDVYTEYVSARHEDYFVTLANVSAAVEEAAATQAAARADAAAAYEAAESQAQQVRRNVFDEIQGRRDAAAAEVQSHIDRVSAVLDAAFVEADIISTETYYVWEKIGYERTGSRYDEYAASIAGKLAQRLSFDEIYLAALANATLDSNTDAEILTAVVAARDAAAATVAANPLPYESAEAVLDELIAAARAVISTRQEGVAERFEARLDPLLDYDIVTPATEAAAAVVNAIVVSDDGDSLERSRVEEEQAATAAYEEAAARATSDRDAAFATADRVHETAVAAVADAVDNVRAAFGFDGWVSAAFGLADAYVVLHDVAIAVESEAQLNDDGSLAAASAIEYASTLRRELANVVDAANFLIDRFTRRTILDVEAEFAQAAEVLFLDAEIFEDALNAARSRAEARAKALSD